MAVAATGVGLLPWALLRLITRPLRHADPEAVPAAPVGLVLGARVYPDGTPSALLRRRLELAARLYHRGTVAVLLVSGGDAGTPAGAEETTAMRRYLRGLGVADAAIVADPGGVDTWHSAYAARAVYGVQHAVVITQSFHLPRAIALCRRGGMQVHGVGDDSHRDHPAPTRIGAWREVAACAKATVTMLTARPPRPARAPRDDVTRALRVSPEPPAAAAPRTPDVS